MKTKSIKLTEIQVNTENYRFEPVENQKEAIERIVENQGEKLLVLAESIIKDGLNPNDRIQVSPSNQDRDKYITLEGNRRVVVLKLLNNPELIENHEYLPLKKKFKKLHDENKQNLLTEIECTVYDSPAEADKWIKLKHAGESGGAGTVSWTSQQIQRFEEKVEGKSSIALQAIKWLEKSDDVPVEIKHSLNDLKITNLDRLLSDPYVRDFLGVEIRDGKLSSLIESTELLKGLTKIAEDLLNPKFSVKKIYTKVDRQLYVDSFPAQNRPDTQKKLTPPTTGAAATSSKPTPKSKTRATPTERKSLIPKTCILTISNPKVNAIYHEFQKLDVHTFTNAAAVLFRVFVELSLDTYLEKHRLVNTPSAAKSGLDLQQKALSVINHLESKKQADKAICKAIRFAIKDSNGLLGIDTLHAYIHNNKFTPVSTNLIKMWDDISAFMETLWSNVP